MLGGTVALRSHGVRQKLRRKGHWLQGVDDFSRIFALKIIEKHLFVVQEGQQDSNNFLESWSWSCLDYPNDCPTYVKIRGVDEAEGSFKT